MQDCLLITVITVIGRIFYTKFKLTLGVITYWSQMLCHLKKLAIKQGLKTDILSF